MREPDQTRSTATRLCSSCGADIGSANFCPDCGEPAFADPPTEDLGPFPRHQAASQRAAEEVRGVEAADRLAGSTPFSSAAPARPAQSYSPQPRGRSSRIALIGGGVVIALAAIGVALALTVFSSSKDSGVSYRQKVADTLQPVVAANRSLSVALAGLHGTHPTAAKQAVVQAQHVTSSAQGALGALSVSDASRQVAAQAREALDRESTYLTAVSSVLNHPSTATRSQLQTLAGNATSALDAVDAPLSGAGQSVTGADTLTTWAQHVTRGKGTNTGGGGGTTGHTPGPYANTRDCGNGLHAGPNTSCDFAQNVRAAWDEAPGVSATVEVYSPVTGQTYTMSCSPAGSGVTCSGGNGASVSW